VFFVILLQGNGETTEYLEDKFLFLALEYAIRRVQVNQDGTHQLLAYADDVNILGGSIHTLKENAVALVAATREIGLEVSADKTKYIGYVSRSECRTNSRCEDG
jgi:hypothetical protein